MKSIIPPSFCLAIALFLSWQPVTAAAEDPFVAKYLAAEKKLLDRYVHNRKVVAHTKFYQLGKDNTSRLFASTEDTSIFSQDSFRSKGTGYQHKEGRQVVGQLSGGLRIPGDGYSLIQGDKSDSYRIQSQSLPPSDLRDISSMPPHRSSTHSCMGETTADRSQSAMCSGIPGRPFRVRKFDGPSSRLARAPGKASRRSPSRSEVHSATSCKGDRGSQ